MKMVQDIIIKPIITEASMDKLADKKYTFKVRGYKKVNGTTVYGKWSAAKKAKIK